MMLRPSLIGLVAAILSASTHVAASPTSMANTTQPQECAEPAHHAFFVMGCSKPIVVERADPIEFPGVASPHLHTIMGGNAFDLAMTYNRTQTSTCTTCGVTKDLSNYWVPPVYFHAANGSFVSVEQVGGINVYYQERMDWTDYRACKTLQPFPREFRMIAGDQARRSYNASIPAHRAVEFVCLLADGQTGVASFPGFPNRTCDGGLQIRFRFPSCWDGVHMGGEEGSDHKSHVAYPSMVDNGVCPSTHPVRIPALLFEMTWAVDAFNALRVDGDQPFVLSQGDPTGYGYHADFFNGWDVDVLRAALRDPTCANPSGGHIDQCETFRPFLQNNTIQNMCLGIEPKVKEPMFGVQDALPGCNPIQSGPANAVTHHLRRRGISWEQGCCLLMVMLDHDWTAKERRLGLVGWLAPVLEPRCYDIRD